MSCVSWTFETIVILEHGSQLLGLYSFGPMDPRLVAIEFWAMFLCI